MLLFLFQMSIYWLIGWAFYQLILSKETFHHLNRFYLLFMLLLGISLPLLEVASPIAAIPTFWLPESIITASSLPNDAIPTITFTNNNWTWEDFIKLVYLLGVIGTTWRFLSELYMLFQLRQEAKTEIYPHYTWVQAKDIESPFSFFHLLFWQEAPYQQSAKHQYVLKHELAHIRQWHSVDKLFLSLLGIIFWWHPMVYLFKYSLEQVHEFLADEAATKDGNKKSYGQLLLSFSSKQKAHSLTNTFIKSPLKNRILMLLQPVSSPLHRWKYFAILPLLAFTFFACQPDILLAQIPEKSDDVATAALEIDTIITFDPATYTETIQVVKRTLGKETTEQISEKSKVPTITERAIAIEGDDYLVDTIITFNPDTYTETMELVKTPFYKEVDEMPTFGDCANLTGKALEECSNTALLTYIYTNISYPEAARKQGFEGTAVAKFIIRTNGFIENISMAKSLSPEIDAEVLRVIQTMSNWTPGKKDGKEVNVQFILPVKFKME